LIEPSVNFAADLVSPPQAKN